MSASPEAAWHARLPAVWPPLPEYVTYSTLREFEACPRRWALSSADYPDVWARRGYPSRLSLARIAGTIVHDVIEKVTGALVANKCSSINAPEAVRIMREFGGFSRLLAESSERALRPYSDNPRAQGQLDAIRRTLRANFADLRRRAQALLITVQMPFVGSSAVDALDAPGPGKRVRGPLRYGAYSEVEVLAPDIRWKGKVDLLSVSPSGCGIIDFKTGEPSDEHANQVRIYALLWSLDRELNPDVIPATSLTVAYTNSKTNVPAPKGQELVALRADVISRTDAARVYGGARPPARPSVDNCTRCDVRQMCDEYWTADVQALIRSTAAHSDSCDGEFTIGARLGTSNWEITPRVKPLPWSTPRSVLRCIEHRVQLNPGQVVRVLDGRIWAAPDQPSVTTLNVGPSSEIYIVEPAH